MNKYETEALLALLLVLAVIILPQIAGFKITDVLGTPEPLPQQVQEAINYGPVVVAVAAVIVIIVIVIVVFGSLASAPAGN